jgi:predicted DNA-binding transcriptional regulator YafY
MSNVATRLLSLILMLQSRPIWKAAGLAVELGVSERTVYRYMGMLEEIGIPIYSERGPYGGFSLVRGYRLPPLLFTAEEATVLYMGANLVREVWGHTYGDAVTAATAKLDNVLPDDLRGEVAQAQQSLAVGGLAARDYRPWEATIHSLRQCIVDHRCARLVYRTPSRQQPTERVVEPYGLAFQWGQWYLAAFCRLRGEMRTFRVDRIHSIAALDEPTAPPPGFDVREYMQQAVRYEPAYTVAVLLEGDAAQSVRDWDEENRELVEHGDGSVTVRFGTDNLAWATRWVLGYGTAARALEPVELVESVRAAAEQILSYYAGRDCT